MMFRMKYIMMVMAMCCISITTLHAQLKRIYIEQYYQSDAQDATDETGGVLAEGSKTYRIYALLEPGSEVLSLFGDGDHPFHISSTAPFFNNIADGQSFAKDFLRARYEENTVALDTWLTIGQVARKQGVLAYFGIPKHRDNNGSFVGGANNDGGSGGIPSGLLMNGGGWMGTALTLTDGIDTSSVVPTNWQSNGVVDFVTGEDTTIFGANDQFSFNSTSFSLSCSGVSSPRPDSNFVLLAQLTTLGELTFNLNMSVKYLENGTEVTTNYVGTNVIVSPNEQYNPFLSFPYACGCTDPAYIEYDETFICELPGACANRVHFGCMDTLACNYDAEANYMVEALCCYPGWCAGRDIEQVCPPLMGSRFDVALSPNPASEVVNVNAWMGSDSGVEVKIFNAFGTAVFQSISASASYNFNQEINTSAWTPGLYYVQVTTVFGTITKSMLKL